MTTLFTIALSLSLMTVAGFFCFVLFRLAQHIENLAPQRRVVVKTVSNSANHADQGAGMGHPIQRKCNSCEATYTGNMCTECGTIPAPEQPRRRFQGFHSIKKRIEEAG